VLEPILRSDGHPREHAYHARLLMYKGARRPTRLLNLNTADDVQIATQGYGSATGIWSTAISRKAREDLRVALLAGKRVAGVRLDCAPRPISNGGF
jgi:hypothetical protein